MHCFTGDDTGLLKRVRLAPAPATERKWGTQAAGGGVGACCWGPSPTKEDFVGTGLDNGIIRFWRASSAAPTASDAAACECEPSKDAAAITALHAAGTDAASARVLACDQRGLVRTWTWPETLDDGDDEAPTVVTGPPVASFETGAAAGIARFTADGAHLATGDKDRDLVVWDVATCQPSFRARNVADDKYDLAVPVWVGALGFVPTQPQLVAMGTGHVQLRLRGEVRLYDVNAKRRPVFRAEAPLGEEAVRALACTADGRYVLAGSTSGMLCRLDMRMDLKVLNRYSHTSGSVRQIEVHETLPLFGCVSLDRHARVYRVDGGSGQHKQQPLHKIYLKQRLSALLLSAEVPARIARDEEDDDKLARKQKLKAAAAGSKRKASAAAGGEPEALPTPRSEGDAAVKKRKKKKAKGAGGGRGAE